MTLLEWNDVMQTIGLGLSAIGIPLTTAALYRAWQTRSQPTEARRVLANGHVFSHAVMLYLQLAFATINTLVLFAPHVDDRMIGDPEGYHAVQLVVATKLLSLSMQIVLTWAVLYKRLERHHLLLTSKIGIER